MKYSTLVLSAIFLFSTLFIAPAHASDLTTNLTSCWAMEETSGTRTDSVGSNDLTDNNTVGSAAGLLGTAADIELSNNEYLSITDGSHTGLDPTGSFSINFWVNRESWLTGNWNGLVSKADNTTRSYMSGILRDGSTYYMAFYVGISGATTFGSLHTLSGDPSGNQMFTLVYNASTQTKYIYQNGNATPIQTETGGPASVNNSSADFRIGWFNNPGPDGYDGLFDDTAFWNGRVLSTTEIAELYDSGAGMSCADIIATGAPPEATLTPIIPIQGRNTASGDVIMSR